MDRYLMTALIVATVFTIALSFNLYLMARGFLWWKRRHGE